MIVALTSIIVSLIGLLVSGQLVIKAALRFSQLMRLSPFIIGTVIMGFATSLPELSVAIKAARAGAPELTMGNVIGSNIANTLLILGLSALLTPLPIRSMDHRSMLVNVLAHGLLMTTFMFHKIALWQGSVLLLVFISYFRLLGTSGAGDGNTKKIKGSKIVSGLVLIGSLAFLIVSADQLVRWAIILARELQVSEKIIGVTVLAVGTSLPEIVMALTAAAYRQPELIYANVLGSNIFNILLTLGLTAIICPIAVPMSLFFDATLALWCSFFLAALVQFQVRAGAKVGALLLLIYSGYIMLNIM